MLEWKPVAEVGDVTCIAATALLGCADDGVGGCEDDAALDGAQQRVAATHAMGAREICAENAAIYRRSFSGSGSARGGSRSD